MLVYARLLDGSVRVCTYNLFARAVFLKGSSICRSACLLHFARTDITSHVQKAVYTCRCFLYVHLLVVRMVA